MTSFATRFIFCFCALAILLAGCDSGSTNQIPDPDRDPAEPADPNATAVFKINPRATFLYVDAEDTADPSFVFDLSEEGITPGTRLKLKRIGELQVKQQETENQTSTKMIGVFSSTDMLTPSNQTKRVSDAIDAGEDHYTFPTFVENEPTNIDEDFFIDELEIVVPEGAKYLFVATPDVRYRDNFDKDDDFKLELTVID